MSTPPDETREECLERIAREYDEGLAEVARRFIDGEIKVRDKVVVDPFEIG